MSYLYVVLFSDGLIKVGRSKNPEKRIEEHEIRLSCAGISISGSHYMKCIGRISSCEFRLIEWCKSRASSMYLKEWFRGLEYQDVIDAASAISLEEDSFHTVPQNSGSGISEFIDLAGGREQLAKMLGVAPISTYRWKKLARKHEDRLRVLKPSWFKAKKGTK